MRVTQQRTCQSGLCLENNSPMGCSPEKRVFFGRFSRFKGENKVKALLKRRLDGHMAFIDLSHNGTA